MTTIACVFGSVKAQDSLRKLYPPKPGSAAAGGDSEAPSNSVDPIPEASAKDASPSDAYTDDTAFENGHAPLAEQFAAHKVTNVVVHIRL